MPPAPEAAIGPPPADVLEKRELVVPVEGVNPDNLVRSFALSASVALGNGFTCVAALSSLASSLAAAELRLR